MAVVNLGNITVRTDNDISIPNKKYPYGIECTIEMGNSYSWSLPLNGISPDDLRALADIIESRKD
ncbi:MAG: hypothetical protein [Bacteriophage sp.]|nr:MAG: hypothetical protein [Bacteriophage sp.]